MKDTHEQHALAQTVVLGVFFGGYPFFGGLPRGKPSNSTQTPLIPVSPHLGRGIHELAHVKAVGRATHGGGRLSGSGGCVFLGQRAALGELHVTPQPKPRKQ